MVKERCAFEKVAQLSTKSRGGCPINDVVVDGDREIENFADLYFAVDYTRTSGHPAYDDLK